MTSLVFALSAFLEQLTRTNRQTDTHTHTHTHSSALYSIQVKDGEPAAFWVIRCSLLWPVKKMFKNAKNYLKYEKYNSKITKLTKIYRSMILSTSLSKRNKMCKFYVVRQFYLRRCIINLAPKSCTYEYNALLLALYFWTKIFGFFSSSWFLGFSLSFCIKGNTNEFS